LPRRLGVYPPRLSFFAPSIVMFPTLHLFHPYADAFRNSDVTELNFQGVQSADIETDFAAAPPVQRQVLARAGVAWLVLRRIDYYGLRA
jgi:hypothetical protein